MPVPDAEKPLGSRRGSLHTRRTVRALPCPVQSADCYLPCKPSAHPIPSTGQCRGVSVRLAVPYWVTMVICMCRVKCFYAGVRWAVSLPKEAVLTRQALASALTSALGQVRPLALFIEPVNAVLTSCWQRVHTASPYRGSSWVPVQLCSWSQYDM